METQQQLSAPNQRLHRLLLLAGFGFLHWFFGNLYEGVVLGPNLLLADNRLNALNAYRAFFSISSPPFYFLPWSPLSVVLIWLAFFVGRKTQNKSLCRWLMVATLCGSLTLALTIYLVTSVNVELYFTTTAYSTNKLNTTITQLTWLGNLRLLLLFSTLFSLYRVYITHFQIINRIE